jgi:multisubunit Na+/H+ antiporter MnhG subunit
MAAALGLILVLQLGMAGKSFKAEGRRWPLPGLCLLAVALAALLAGPMLWEGARLARHAHRPAPGGTESTLYSQPPLLSLEMFLPNPLGFSFEDKNEFRGARFYGARNPYLVSVYVGLGLLPLAGLGLLAPRPRRSMFLLAGFLGFLVLSWGGHVPGLLRAMRWLPLLSWARYPQKFMIPASLLFILLGTIGLHRLFEMPAAASRASWKHHGWFLLPVLAVLGMALLVPEFSLRNLAPLGVLSLAAVFGSIAAGWHRPAAHRWTCRLAGLLLAADLVLANGFAVPLAPADTLRSPVPLLAAVQQDGAPPGSYRVAVEPHPANVPGGGADALWYMLFLKNAGFPYFGMTQGALYAFDLMLDQTQTWEMNALREGYLRRPLDQRVQLMQRLGVRFLISGNNYVHPGLAVVQAESLAPGCIFKVYRVAGARDRLAFYPAVAADASPDPAAAIDRLVSLPPDQVLMEGSVLPPDFGRLRSGGTPDTATLSSIDYESSRVTVEINCPTPGVLVLRDGFAPGWSAVVDGKPAPVHRTDAFFLGIALPPGNHRVEFRYRPMALPWLLLVSLAAGGGAVLGLLFGDRWCWSGLPHRQPDHEGC